MPRRLTPSQFRSKLRQAEATQRQSVQKAKRAVRQYNNKVRQYNAARKQVIDAHNREARAYNARVRANRARLQSARQRLSQQTVSARYTSLHQSVSKLYAAYERLDNSDADPLLSDLAEQDTANSVTVFNSLIADIDYPQVSNGKLASTKISESLASISTDLNDRWSGALFTLDPRNRDAARHFCISTREIIADILNAKAPDADVFAWSRDCQITDQGTPTRRAKILYCMERHGVYNDDLERFIDANIKDLTVLFDDLNAGSHGPAGRFSLPQLVAIKTRVEDAIGFICEIAS